MIALFKQKSPANVVILLLFGLLIKLPIFLYIQPLQPTAGDGKLYEVFIQYVVGNNALIASIISFILIYIQALMINYLVNEYRMTAKPTFLPAMAYILITSLLPEWSYLSAALLSNTLLIWIIMILFKLYQPSSANGNIYNIGLLLGICTFIFFPSVLLVLPLLIGLMILRPFRLNEIVLMVAGVLSPYYFYSAYLFLTDQFDVSKLLPVFSFKVPQLENSIWLVGTVLLIGIPFLASGYYIQKHLRKMLIQARKNWSILLLYLLISLFVPVLTITGFFKNVVVATVPFAAFHACAYLYPPRKWLSTLLFFLTIAFILVQQYATALWQK